ncbi:hypothetical protein [Fusobacterium sp.]|uniref:hypothetical protein n=1 Tax=Fusobacterium sp. TaxID=68766 RepID=UPI002623D040|nr:hypothetical protein [Fusobacterium sp.]
MLIIELILIFLSYKYIPKLKEKVNSEYNKRFNFIIFSKENLKKPFIGSMFIVFGFFYGQFKPTDKISSIGLILVGVGIFIKVVYETYKKTDLKYGTIAAFIYICVMALQITFGVMMAIALFAVLLFSCMGDNSRRDNYYDY